MEEELPRKENCNLKVVPLTALQRYSVSRYLENVEHSVLATELSRLAQPCVDVLTACCNSIGKRSKQYFSGSFQVAKNLSDNEPRDS